MDCTPGRPMYFAIDSFPDDEQLENSIIIFEIITISLLSVPLMSKETYQFTALMEYTLFAFKVNCVIALAPSFCRREKSLFSHKSISIIPIP